MSRKIVAAYLLLFFFLSLVESSLRSLHELSYPATKLLLHFTRLIPL